MDGWMDGWMDGGELDTARVHEDRGVCGLVRLPSNTAHLVLAVS